MLQAAVFSWIGIVALAPTPSSAVKPLEVRLGAAVTLQCDLSYHYEINWLRMSSDMKPQLLTVLRLKNNGDLSVTWSSDNNNNNNSFQGFIQNRFFQLRIASVSEADLATYFCAAVTEHRLEFGEGTRLYAVSDVQRRRNLDHNLTPCDKGYKGSKAETPRSHFHTHMIISGTLSCGVLLMILAIITVHLMTSDVKFC